MASTDCALIAVDVQYDFLPGGSLAVPDSDAILRPLAALASRASLVVTTRDWHPDNHFSFVDEPTYSDASWPPHCVQGTKGARIHPGISKYADFVISKGMGVNPPDAYSAFAGRTLRPIQTLEEILLRFHGNTIIIAGLALDYCVYYTACDANTLPGFQVVVPLDCTRGVDPESTKHAIDRMTALGIHVVSSS